MTKEIWFDGTQEPVRSGVYKRDYHLRVIHYAYFCCENRVWGVYAESAEFAKDRFDRFSPSPSQKLPWGGLAKEPK